MYKRFLSRGYNRLKKCLKVFSAIAYKLTKVVITTTTGTISTTKRSLKVYYCIEGTEMRQLGFKVRRLLFLNRY